MEGPVFTNRPIIPHQNVPSDQIVTPIYKIPMCELSVYLEDGTVIGRQPHPTGDFFMESLIHTLSRCKDFEVAKQMRYELSGIPNDKKGLFKNPTNQYVKNMSTYDTRYRKNDVYNTDQLDDIWWAVETVTDSGVERKTMSSSELIRHTYHCDYETTTVHVFLYRDVDETGTKRNTAYFQDMWFLLLTPPNTVFTTDENDKICTTVSKDEEFLLN